MACFRPVEIGKYRTVELKDNVLAKLLTLINMNSQCLQIFGGKGGWREDKIGQVSS